MIDKLFTSHISVNCISVTRSKKGEKALRSVQTANTVWPLMKKGAKGEEVQIHMFSPRLLIYLHE